MERTWQATHAGANIRNMAPLRAHVRNGRLLLDEPTNLPDGAEVQLLPVDGDDLDDEDRRRLHEALAESEEDEAQGRTFPADDVLAELRRHLPR